MVNINLFIELIRAPPLAGRDRQLIAVDEALDAFVVGAMHAAKNGVAMLHAVADDAVAAMGADRGECLNCAFEAIEDERAAAHGDLEAPIVVIAALRAFAHGDVLHLNFMEA